MPGKISLTDTDVNWIHSQLYNFNMDEIKKCPELTGMDTTTLRESLIVAIAKGLITPIRFNASDRILEYDVQLFNDQDIIWGYPVDPKTKITLDDSWKVRCIDKSGTNHDQNIRLTGHNTKDVDENTLIVVVNNRAVVATRSDIFMRDFIDISHVDEFRKLFEEYVTEVEKILNEIDIDQSILTQLNMKSQIIYGQNVYGDVTTHLIGMDVLQMTWAGGTYVMKDGKFVLAGSSGELVFVPGSQKEIGACHDQCYCHSNCRAGCGRASH